MLSEKRKFGDRGEELAIKLLTNNRFYVIERNYRLKNIGEIDIIAKKKNLLVFFEVKTRHVSHETHFPVNFSIGFKKRSILKKICKIYLQKKNYPLDQQWRVDAILIEIKGSTRENIQHIENILWEEYY
jgi:putative endonuclease